ncbi:hypothetical protein K491DRAFT_780616 [Lophiostoma macrostomum CBS 122681]|uniref:Uncharacterized protein n=1 Tax=Lophiostoma macrostomum CBS 122681 TaxID=1314788 RepID=A0A6A6T2F5_9PLEO|nr:hypothetical protein K491DRAFT_780616 [Lophiostoma macrostomum CBS 122681]
MSGPNGPPPSKKTLKIHPTPFKPSHLSTPPSPFSPRTPLSPQPLPQLTSRIYPTPDPSELPPSPLQWLWQCHQCHRTYALGVTRRCLEDGHLFCAGTTTVKNWRKALSPRRVKRHRACASEFDYQGWKSWGRWKRSGRRDSIYDDNASDSSSPVSTSSSSSGASYQSSSAGRNNGKTATRQVKDCWNTCDYPSECRWGRKFGVHTPLSAEFPTLIKPPSGAQGSSPLSTSSSSPSLVSSSSSSFSSSSSSSAGGATAANTTFEGILKSENVHAPTTSTSPSKSKTERTDFWGALLASASRRKSTPPSSPLCNVPEEAEPSSLSTSLSPSTSNASSASNTSTAAGTSRDREGDILMMNATSAAPEAFINPAQLTTSMAASITASAPVVTLKEMIKKTSKRGRYSKGNEAKKAVRGQRAEAAERAERVERVESVEHGMQAGASDPMVGGLGACEGASESVEDLVVHMDFAPLERVKSRDSGYGSNIEGL